MGKTSKMKNYLLVFFSAVWVITMLFAATMASAEEKPVISFAEESYTVAVGKSATLKVKITPKSNMKLEWASSDEGVASVSPKGVVKAVSAGEAEIQVRSQDDHSICASCKVVVVVPVKKISLTDKTIALAADTSWKLECVFEPEDATDKRVSWASSNESVAKVDQDGLVTGVSIGSAKITGTTLDGSKKKVTVNVKVNEYDIVITTPAAVNNKLISARHNPTVKTGCVTLEAVKDEIWIKPVKAGEDIIEYSFSTPVTGVINRKVPVYVAQSAIPQVNKTSSRTEREDNPDGKILFRGIPWGSTVDETLGILKESSSWIKVVSEKRVWKEKFANWPDYVTVISIKVQVPGLAVAGFPTLEDKDGANITLYFLPKVPDGYTAYSKSEGSFVAAEYYGIGSLVGKSTNELKQELSKKLDSLYGENDGETWQKDGICISMNEVKHREQVVDMEYEMTRKPTQPIKYKTAYVTIGYGLVYSNWSESVRKEAEIIQDIDHKEEEREKEEWEQEKREKEQREQEKKEEEEESRGYDGL